VLSILDISAQVLVALFGLSLYQGFMRWYWDLKTPAERKKLFFTVLSSVGIISIILGSLLAFNSSLISYLLYNTEIYSRAILLVIVNAVLMSIQVLPNSSMRIQGKSKLYTSLSVLKFTTNLLFTVYFVVFLKRGIEGIFEAQIIGSILYFVFASKYILKNSIAKIQLGVLKELLIYSYPLVFASMSGILLTTIDRFSLNYMATLPDVAIYSLGFKIGGSIKVFIVTSVQLALTPMLLKRINDPNNKRLYSKVLTYFSFGLMWIILAISVFSREIIILIAKSPEYIEATYIVPIIAMISFFGMAKDSVVMGLHVHKKTKIIGIVIVIAAVANLLLNMLLIPLWGIYGAALASLIAQFILFGLTFYFAQKSYHINYELGKVLMIIAVGAILFGISLLLNDFNIWISFGLKVLITLSFPVWFFLFPFFEDIEKDSIRGGIRKYLKR
jgi:O-antigen/teichoic acid export membrane protein